MRRTNSSAFVQACWAAAWIITLQAISGLLLEAITIGIIFRCELWLLLCCLPSAFFSAIPLSCSRISHPKQRGRSIFISESAIIARRDGILKFMFRVADIRSTQVVNPQIKAFMYSEWVLLLLQCNRGHSQDFTFLFMPCCSLGRGQDHRRGRAHSW